MGANSSKNNSTSSSAAAPATTASSSTTPNNNTASARAAISAGTQSTNHANANMFLQMDPQQIKQQAALLKSMPPSQLRLMHPQFAQMTDAQIQQSAAQMEMLAGNPALLQMAADQMKNMSPEDLQAAQEGRMPMSNAAGNNTTMDPTSLLSNMSGKQLQDMAKAAKQNPEMTRNKSKAS